MRRKIFGGTDNSQNFFPKMALKTFWGGLSWGFSGTFQGCLEISCLFELLNKSCLNRVYFFKQGSPTTQNVNNLFFYLWSYDSLETLENQSSFFVKFFLFPNLALNSAFASQMAWLGIFSLRVFLSPMPQCVSNPRQYSHTRLGPFGRSTNWATALRQLFVHSCMIDHIKD